ncbi:endogenous retrovirus group S71 member 1 Env polyprotein-like [Heterocephalus glaber]|uniref:Endogenous retrovirus group S71 member 1 Env polyprotein-like n=1 Tax=Heterocephalus glaber TaxID=10181 RepID=A0AAX6RPG1_HETGA|nr:endogenous retrovirus group S71 member 1 Env polyprotein-like [Heterocephalus glaber]XP_021098213.1 endogenous retrovirus group S71 member 1 Env polyprotein-like [Heterocephalus glaber]XP_021098214.1 endogenous retrovirus group S71 member 1 Env polyprotein-like [Heterocephalus glaber]XP_021098215.1 endogenous retrovirus group S71 member 1 Env polyprotein-like [Heterocephalus glaber]
MEGGAGCQLVLSSHTSQNWTWSLKNALTGAHIATITMDRQPHFIIDLCSLGLPIISGGGAGSKGKVSSGKMGKGGHGGRCGIDDKLEKTLQDIDIYACPIGKNKRCNGGPGNHCHHWGCESIAPWKNDDAYLALEQQTPSGSCSKGKCNPIKLTLKQWQNPYKDWEKGKSWMVALYVGEKDPMTDLLIQHSPVIVSPNPVGNIYRVSGPQEKEKAKGTYNVSLVAPESLIQPYLKTLDAMYTLLNESSPNLTQGCWLCLSLFPPYYVGLAVNGTFSEADQNECDWKQLRLSIGDIKGKGLCVKKSKCYIILSGQYMFLSDTHHQ